MVVHHKVLMKTRKYRSRIMRARYLRKYLTEFEFGAFSAGVKQAITNCIIVPVRHFAEFINPIASAMTIYTACGLVLFSTSLYAISSVYTKATLYAKRKKHIDAKIFGIKQYASAEVLFLIATFAAGVLAFTNISAHFGVVVGEQHGFILFELPELLLVKTPEFFLVTLPHLITTEAPAALYLLLFEDFPYAVTTVIDFVTLTLPYFFFELLPERITIVAYNFPGECRQYYAANVEPTVKIIQRGLTFFFNLPV